MICTEDPKRSIGLWHGVLSAAYNGIHVVYVPPNVMSTLPTAWLHMIHKHKGIIPYTLHNGIHSPCTPVATVTHMCNPPVHFLNTKANYVPEICKHIVTLSMGLVALSQPMPKFGWQSEAVCVGCGVSVWH